MRLKESALSEQLLMLLTKQNWHCFSKFKPKGIFLSVTPSFYDVPWFTRFAPHPQPSVFTYQILIEVRALMWDILRECGRLVMCYFKLLLMLDNRCRSIQFVLCCHLYRIVQIILRFEGRWIFVKVKLYLNWLHVHAFPYKRKMSLQIYPNMSTRVEWNLTVTWINRFNITQHHSRLYAIVICVSWSYVLNEYFQIYA